MKAVRRIGLATLLAVTMLVLNALPLLAQTPEEEAAARAVTAGILITTICSIVAVVVGLVVWIIIAVWVYRDAKRRGAPEVLWLIIALLTGLIGLIIYLVVRPKEIVAEAKKEEAPPPPPTPPTEPTEPSA
jgi:heme/copper-type cytochrome/quinol oxidase subunit 2